MLLCDTSEVAISAVIHHKKGEDLAPTAYYSHLSPAERRCSVLGKECLAVVFGCEDFWSGLEHKEFILHTYNQPLSCLCRHAEESDNLGQWMLLVVLFEFMVYHIAVKTSLVMECHWDLHYT
jgi:hypothetical protein